MSLLCPYCRKKNPPVRASKQCRHCGCGIAVLYEVSASARDSLLLALEALREGRDRDAHEFAYESWGLRNSREAAAAGLVAAVALGDPVEIPRWIRRRRAL